MRLLTEIIHRHINTTATTRRLSAPTFHHSSSIGGNSKKFRWSTHTHRRIGNGRRKFIFQMTYNLISIEFHSSTIGGNSKKRNSVIDPHAQVYRMRATKIYFPNDIFVTVFLDRLPSLQSSSIKGNSKKKIRWSTRTDRKRAAKFIFQTTYSFKRYIRYSFLDRLP